MPTSSLHQRAAAKRCGRRSRWRPAISATLSYPLASVVGMATYVLVPGFWLGAWAWRAVADDLRARGHDVYPLSLTGLGERAHLARPEIDLDTHVTDVVNLLRYEDLRDAVLVGHSYAGLVVTAAADREHDRVSQLVYVDTGPLPDGVAQVEFSPPEEQERTAAAVAEHGDGWRLPPPPWKELAAAASDVDDATLIAAVWDLVWAGELTNDTLAPLRTLLGAGGARHPSRRRPCLPRSSPRPAPSRGF